jgi:hypothetical protein
MFKIKENEQYRIKGRRSKDTFFFLVEEMDDYAKTA